MKNFIAGEFRKYRYSEDIEYNSFVPSKSIKDKINT
jgi:hypothetical protein